MHKLQEYKDQYLTWYKKTPTSNQYIGIEFEQFIANKQGNMPEYESSNGPGIRYMLELLMEHFQAKGIYEGTRLIGLTLQSGGSITLEPGGQLELSGGMFDNLHQVALEVENFASACDEVFDKLGWQSFGVGTHPWLKLHQIPWMPKERYNIMRHYMPGRLAKNMMKQTCTVQVNLDYSSEQDMIRKLRISTKLQPFVTALFATSSIVHSKNSGYMSYRWHIWEHTDKNRTVMPSSLFDSDFGFHSWIDYALNIPMFFVYRDGYINVAGESFPDFLERKIPKVEHIIPTMDDFIDQLSIAFPPVRLKSYIEMRGADAGGGNSYLALAAFWTGLFYDPMGLDALEAYVNRLPLLSYDNVSQFGLLAIPNARHVMKNLLDMAYVGLEKRKYAYKGKLETQYLQYLYRILDQGYSRSYEFLLKAEHQNLQQLTYDMFGMHPKELI